MRTRHRILLLVALPLALVWCVSAAQAATSGCTGGKVSAIDEYCETIPAASGGQSPGPGSPTLGTSLPHSTAVKLARSGKLRSLLGLPAAPGNGRISHGRPSRTGRPGSEASTGLRTKIAAVSAQSLSVDLVLVLILIALAMIAIAAARRWLPRLKGTSSS
jgi:hypothetical protein